MRISMHTQCFPCITLNKVSDQEWFGAEKCERHFPLTALIDSFHAQAWLGRPCRIMCTSTLPWVRPEVSTLQPHAAACYADD
ncbi:hypothetical protein J6590_061556 [Homalodisca vitripennis]|nr:hypothetical protein J6590_061556 [Homalodisca vitripennis]